MRRSVLALRCARSGRIAYFDDDANQAVLALAVTCKGDNDEHHGLEAARSALEDALGRHWTAVDKVAERATGPTAEARGL